MKHPGEHFRELERNLGIGSGTLKYHLEKLMEAGMIVSEKQGKYRLYYRAGQTRCGPHLTPAQEIIVKIIRKHPGIDARAIAEGGGRSVRTVHYHLRTLSDMGVIREVRKDGRAVWYVFEVPF